MKNLHYTLLGVLMIGALSFSTGCVAHARLNGSAHIDTSPNLVLVSPGLWVVEDYDSSVFYSDGYYWRTDGGVWYRSRAHTGGWVTIHANVVPNAVVRVDRPGRYVRYHAPAGARVKHGPKAKSNSKKPKVRDHRSDAKHDNRHGDKHDNRRGDKHDNKHGDKHDNKHGDKH